MSSHSKNAPEVEINKVYGKAAKSMASNEFKKKFGNTTGAGARGERLLFERLRNHILPSSIPLFCSMHVTGKKSDIDFAIVSGKKILLIDAKYMRQDGGFYWNLGHESRSIYKGFGKYKTSNGKDIQLSRSMDMAKDIVGKKLPGFTVESIVVFVTDPRAKNAKMPTTTLLHYPGGIKVFNERGANRYIRSFIRGQKRTWDTVKAENVLKSMVQ